MLLVAPSRESKQRTPNVQAAQWAGCNRRDIVADDASSAFHSTFAANSLYFDTELADVLRPKGHYYRHIPQFNSEISWTLSSHFLVYGFVSLLIYLLFNLIWFPSNRSLYSWFTFSSTPPKYFFSFCKSSWVLMAKCGMTASLAPYSQALLYLHS